MHQTDGERYFFVQIDLTNSVSGVQRTKFEHQLLIRAAVTCHNESDTRDDRQNVTRPRLGACERGNARVKWLQTCSVHF